MPIQKLKDSTVRTLGALQTLTDPVCLVKELIDNALDAHATSIAIEISINTLDVIQLRDNGRGIAPEDRAMVARPNCTSKITTDSDIKSVRGTSLGFRGQALASAAELSGSMTITTRAEGEQTGTSLVVDQSGEVVHERRASHPVGTTVRITDFVAANPVRKQVLLKSADKAPKKLRELLQSYAFARPHVRLALRIIKAKSEKNNFLYVPTPDSTIEDVAMRLLGSACTAQCQTSGLQDSGMQLTAFLPMATAHPGRVTGVGNFIVVDGRPVSPKRGTLKQVIALFRGALKAVNHAFQNAKDIFLYLDISCPGAVYDPNIEPAKDDVLFENPEIVLAAAKSLFRSAYGSPEPHVGSQFLSTGSINIQPEAVQAIPHQSILQPTNPSVLNREMSPVVRAPQTPSSSIFRPSGGGDDDSELSLPYSTYATEMASQELHELHEAHYNIQTSNPWILAKLNAPLRRPRTGIDENRCPSPTSDSSATEDDLHPRRSTIMTPGTSSLPHASYVGAMPLPSQPSGDGRHPTFNPAVGATRLEDILQASPSPHPSILDLARPKSLQTRPSSTWQDGHSDVDSRTDENRRQRPRRDASRPFQSFRQSGTNRRFKPPARVVDDDRPPLWFGRQAAGTPVACNRQGSITQRPRRLGLVQQGELDEPELASASLAPSRHNRDIRDFVDLTGDGPPLTPTAITTSSNVTMGGDIADNDDGSERNGTAVRTTTPNTNMLLRRRSSRLSLERIPIAKRMQNVICRVNTSTEKITAAMNASNEAAFFMSDKAGPEAAGSGGHIGPDEAGYITGMLRTTLLQQIPGRQLVEDFQKIVVESLIRHASSSRFGEEMLL